MIPVSDRREARLALKLWKMGYADIYQGITEPGEPKERLRRLIIAHRLQDKPVFRRENGSTISLGEAFRETFLEDL